MGYVLRVKLASFFAGAAAASIPGLYVLYNDYKLAHHSISDQDVPTSADHCTLDDIPSKVARKQCWDF